MRLLSTALLALIFTASAFADNWPAWRGPTGQGVSADTSFPTEWSETKNVRWKVALADPGNSTPVVWDDKIFITQANKGGSVRSLLCFARADGKLLWQKNVEYPHKEQNWNPTWYANASPVVELGRVIVSFASAGMFCFDHDGKELWKRTDLGHWEHQFGNASSPVLYRDLAILWCGPNALPAKDNATGDKTPAKGKGSRNVLLAVDKATGKTVWERDEKTGSWGTPLVVTIGGQDQLLLSFVPSLKAYDPASGKDLWFCNGLTKYAYASAIYGNGVAVAMSGYQGDAFAVKVGGSGDITKDRLWQQFEKQDKNPQRVGTGMIIGDHVYMMEENGMPRCFELMTGKEVWQVPSRPGAGTTWGSMVSGQGKLFVLMRDASTLVFNANPKYELVGTNRLEGATNSSLAISNGDVFIRTHKHLYCISEKR